MIAPIILACGERYARCATIAIESWYRYHDETLYIVTDRPGDLAGIRGVTPLGDYAKRAMDDVGFYEFHAFQYDSGGKHSRMYSSLKPLIMDHAVSDLAPGAEYVLGLDADTLFSGNILARAREEVGKDRGKIDLYMVERTDPRILQVFDQAPEGGFTLWRRKGRFIEMFQAGYREEMAGPKGGSQNLTNLIRKRIPFRLLGDPLLHFVSPDEKNPQITDEEIAAIKPAYIHLHGKGSYGRLQRFQRVFGGEG